MNSREKHLLCVCTECLTVGHKIKVMQGSWAVRVILYMCGVVPGIAYSSWQQSTIKHVCPGCKKDSMIPVDTPKGRQLMTDAEPFVYERSIDAAVPVVDHDISASYQAEPPQNSVATINRTVGLFVICGLILSALMWWKFGRMDKEIITKIDFRNHTYSSAGFRSEPVALKNGKFIDHGDFGTNFNSVEYVDFNNDGEDEAVISLGTDVDGSAAYIEDYFVYSYQKGQLKEIYHTERENPPKEIKIVGNAMVITGYHWKPDDSHSSPSDIETTTYGWKDSAIKILSSNLKPIPKEQELTDVVYSPSGMPSNIKVMIDQFHKDNCIGPRSDDDYPEVEKACEDAEKISERPLYMTKINCCQPRPQRVLPAEQEPTMKLIS